MTEYHIVISYLMDTLTLSLSVPLWSELISTNMLESGLSRIWHIFQFEKACQGFCGGFSDFLIAFWWYMFRDFCTSIEEMSKANG